jgi:tRNA pseudouridine55 synthase
LTALRRTQVGPYGLAESRTLDELSAAVERGEPVPIIPIAVAAAAAFPRRDVDADEAKSVVHGGFLAAAGIETGSVEVGPVAVFGPDGAFLALVEERGGRAKPIAVFA